MTVFAKKWLVSTVLQHSSSVLSLHAYMSQLRPVFSFRSSEPVVGQYLLTLELTISGWSLFLYVISVVDQCYQCNTVNVNQSGFSFGAEAKLRWANKIQVRTTDFEHVKHVLLLFHDKSFSSLYRSFFVSCSMDWIKLFESFEIRKKSLCPDNIIVGSNLFTSYRLRGISCNLKPLKLPASGSALTAKKGNGSKWEMNFKEWSYNRVSQFRMGAINVTKIKFYIVHNWVK